MENECAQDELPKSYEISFLDGVLNIVTQQFYRHSPKSFTTYEIQANYAAANEVDCPVFRNFLWSITCGDRGIQDRIWEMLGYVLSPDTDGKVMFLLQGCSNSGKSVLASLIKSFFTPDVTTALDVHSLNERFAPVELEGRAVWISPDLSAGALDNKSTSKLKQFSGNDMVSADKRYKGYVNFYCTAKLIMCTNYPLLTHEKDPAFEGRIVAIPFVRTIPQHEQRRDLAELLKRERDAICRGAMRAYFRLRQNGHRFSGEYQLNSASVLYQSGNNRLDIESCVYTFLQNYFEACDDDGVFTCDAHRLFVEEYGNIPLNTFSQYFMAYAVQIYRVKKERKRKAGEKNAISYILGIKQKEVK